MQTVTCGWRDDIKDIWIHNDDEQDNVFYAVNFNSEDKCMLPYMLIFTLKRYSLIHVCSCKMFVHMWIERKDTNVAGTVSESLMNTEQDIYSGSVLLQRGHWLTRDQKSTWSSDHQGYSPKGELLASFIRPPAIKNEISNSNKAEEPLTNRLWELFITSWIKGSETIS